MRIALLLIALMISLPACDRVEQQTSTPTAAPVVLVVDIEGMHCTACAASISATLQTCDGIQSADVSFDDRNATITADDANALQQAMQVAREMGYTIETARAESN